MTNLYLFTGDHRRAMNEKLKFWQEEFLKKHGEGNLSRFEDVKQEDLKTIINAIDCEPFLGQKRLIMIEGIPPSAENAKTIRLDALEDILEKIPQTSIVVFVSENPDQRLRFYKKLESLATIETFFKPKGADLKRWVIQSFQKQRKQIRLEALEKLLYFTHEDIDELHNEIEKLTLLSADIIAENHIEQHVTSNPETRIFKFLEGIGKKSSSESIQELRKLFQQEEDHLMVVYMIVRQFRLLVQLRYLLDQGMGRGAIQKKLSLKPFILKLLLDQVKYFQLDDLIKAYQRLTDLDYRLKTGKISISPSSKLLELRLDQFLYACAE